MADDEPKELGLPLESPRRLSRSMVWELQRQFYVNAGPEAWRLEITPSEITSNPFIAHAYARVIRAFFGETRSSSKPGRVIELGTGSGRFGWLLATELERQRRGEEAGYQVVLTDIAELNLEAAASHPCLKEAAAGGLVDFASFDAERPDPLRLRLGGDVLRPGGSDEPLVIIANYVVDSLRHDCFLVNDHEIYETRAGVVLTDKGKPRIRDPDILHRVVLACKNAGMSLPYYDDPLFDGLLELYRRDGPNGFVLFPIAAMRAFAWLRGLTRGPVLVLCGDKGFRNIGDVEHSPGPHVTPHGSFSMTVNFHALRKWAEGVGGVAWQCSDGDEIFLVNGFALSRRTLRQTEEAFRAHIARFSPHQYQVLLGDGLARDASLTGAVEAIRLGNFDPYAYRRYAKRLREDGPKLKNHEKLRLALDLERVALRHYRIQKQDPLFAMLADTLYALGAMESALRVLRRMVDQDGPTPAAMHSMGLCLEALGKADAARKLHRIALELDPAHEDARARLGALDGEDH